MPPDQHHIDIIARALEDLATEIEEIGIALCGDPALVAAHGRALQAIDFISQRQRSLAALLTTDDLDAALRCCPLERVTRLFDEASVR